MSLTKTQFEVLFSLLEADKPLTQREISHATGLSLGTVNVTVRELEAHGYAKTRTITDAGIEALKPYRVRNAVILAAGMAQRFAPNS